MKSDNQIQRQSLPTAEKEIRCQSGWAVLPAILLGIIVPVSLLIIGIVDEGESFVVARWYFFVGTVFWTALMVLCFTGLFANQPNESRVLTLFGDYVGTERRAGFYWTNPFNRKFKVSLRSRNLNGDKLKVNDRMGNPIEIAAVVVWRVRNTAMACFDVESFDEYVRIQSESAVRHLANTYSYDGSEDDGLTLRDGGEKVNEDLVEQLQERFSKAGIEVEEARITHLAYAPEIAQAMLRRQQAEAIIAARQKIVHGAVSMVEMALEELASKEVVDLDNERKAAMIGNLMVVLCAESEVKPVINTGTLYH